MFRRLVTLWGLMAAVHLAAAAAATQSPQAVPIEGKPFSGRIKSIDRRWNVRFDLEQSGQPQRSLNAASLAWWGAFAEATTGPQFQLLMADGGIFIADEIEIKDEDLIADSILFGQVKLKLELLRGIVFRQPSDRLKRDLLKDRILSARGESDRVLFNNGDNLSGTVISISQETVLLEVKADNEIKIDIDKIEAIILDPSLVETPKVQGLHAIVGLSDGSRFITQQMTLNQKQATLKIAGNIELSIQPQLKPDTPVDRIVALQPLGGSATYLSDIKASGYHHEAFLKLPWNYRTDRNVLGGHLRARGKLYLKGLGMHSASELVYPIQESQFKQFQAELAIDDFAGPRGSVVFRVFVDDGSAEWKLRYTSAIIRGNSPLQHMSVDLQGVKRIRLRVEFADRGDVLDHADWLGARLVKIK